MDRGFSLIQPFRDDGKYLKNTYKIKLCWPKHIPKLSCLIFNKMALLTGVQTGS